MGDGDARWPGKINRGDSFRRQWASAHAKGRQAHKQEAGGRAQARDPRWRRPQAALPPLSRGCARAPSPPRRARARRQCRSPPARPQWRSCARLRGVVQGRGGEAEGGLPGALQCPAVPCDAVHIASPLHPIPALLSHPGLPAAAAPSSAPGRRPPPAAGPQAACANGRRASREGSASAVGERRWRLAPAPTHPPGGRARQRLLGNHVVGAHAGLQRRLRGQGGQGEMLGCCELHKPEAWAPRSEAAKRRWERWAVPPDWRRAPAS